VSGATGRVLLETGDMEAGVFWAGMIQGLIHDIPTCKELIDRIIGDAQAIIEQRFSAMRRA
jgi:NADH:quinone reductase (non-electrogenic)